MNKEYADDQLYLENKEKDLKISPQNDFSKLESVYCNFSPINKIKNNEEKNFIKSKNCSHEVICHGEEKDFSDFLSVGSINFKQKNFDSNSENRASSNTVILTENIPKPSANFLARNSKNLKKNLSRDRSEAGLYCGNFDDIEKENKEIISYLDSHQNESNERKKFLNDNTIHYSNRDIISDKENRYNCFKTHKIISETLYNTSSSYNDSSSNNFYELNINQGHCEVENGEVKPNKSIENLNQIHPIKDIYETNTHYLENEISQENINLQLAKNSSIEKFTNLNENVKEIQNIPVIYNAENFLMDKQFIEKNLIIKDKVVILCNKIICKNCYNEIKCKNPDYIEICLKCENKELIPYNEELAHNCNELNKSLSASSNSENDTSIKEESLDKEKETNKESKYKFIIDKKIILHKHKGQASDKFAKIEHFINEKKKESNDLNNVLNINNKKNKVKLNEKYFVEYINDKYSKILNNNNNNINFTFGANDMNNMMNEEKRELYDSKSNEDNNAREDKKETNNAYDENEILDISAHSRNIRSQKSFDSSNSKKIKKSIQNNSNEIYEDNNNNPCSKNNSSTSDSKKHFPIDFHVSKISSINEDEDFHNSLKQNTKTRVKKKLNILDSLDLPKLSSKYDLMQCPNKKISFDFYPKSTKDVVKKNFLTHKIENDNKLLKKILKMSKKKNNEDNIKENMDYVSKNNTIKEIINGKVNSDKQISKKLASNKKLIIVKRDSDKAKLSEEISKKLYIPNEKAPPNSTRCLLCCTLCNNEKKLDPNENKKSCLIY